MIDETKKYEAIYLKNLKEKLLENFSSSFESQSLGNELNQIEETFRDPYLLIETVKDMQQKQKESLNDIKMKLNEMNQVKVNLMATNYFKPNLSSFDQERGTSLFGSIKLNQYSNMNPLKSEIINDEQQMSELLKLCEFSPNNKWTLLYRATRDGFGAKDFHSKCDNKSPTLSICKAHDSSCIFGGFASVTLNGPKIFKSDPNAFIFSLTNKDNTPLKMKVEPDEHQNAIQCDMSYGPIFGWSDIAIFNNANSIMSSSSNLGSVYRHPQYAHGTNEAKSFLAGSYKFQLDEIEVYQKEE
jgi:hypothetical protein